MRVAALFWRVQGRVVDRARGVVARWQDIPRPSAEPPGPLLLAGGTFPLDVVADHPLVQPDATSCGSATLVMLRMLRSPADAAEVLGAPDRDAAFGAGRTGGTAPYQRAARRPRPGAAALAGVARHPAGRDDPAAGVTRGVRQPAAAATTTS